MNPKQESAAALLKLIEGMQVKLPSHEESIRLLIELESRAGYWEGLFADLEDGVQVLVE